MARELLDHRRSAPSLRRARSLVAVGGLLAGLMLAGFSCGKTSPPLSADSGGEIPPPSPEVAQAALEKGRMIAAQAFGLLSSNLLQAVNQYGVSNALPFCSAQAIPLTTLVAHTNGVQLQRVSHKPRNPANRATASELELIDHLERRLKSGQPVQPTVLASASNQVTFYAAIVITNRLCLQCHGIPEEDITIENLVTINRLYPRDEATGFQLGDLRGLWRIDFASEALGVERPHPPQ